MQRIRISSLPWMGLGLLACWPMGCAQYDPVTRTTMAGSGLGAVTGAIIGERIGTRRRRGLGGSRRRCAGRGLGRRCPAGPRQRDAAYAYAQNAQQQQYLAGAVTNTDVIYMAQNGLGEEVIINAIQTRGGRFDTSPQSLINLKSQGVSDNVIRVMQSGPPAAAPAAYVAPPPPPPAPVLIVEPPPRPIYFGRFGPPYRCRPHRHPRSGIYIEGRF